jgi:putative PEP-CTERM system histidine kinase
VTWAAVAIFGVTAFAYAAALLISFATRLRHGPIVVLRAAFAVTAVWAGFMAVLVGSERLPLPVVIGLDVTHLLAWIACVLFWLPPTPVRLGVAAAAGVTGLWAVLASLLQGSLGATLYPALVMLALAGVLAVEQVFRNASTEQRKALRLLCFGVGGVMIVDLFVYSQAALLDGTMSSLWLGRGLANVALLPFIVIAAKRQTFWERDLFVSRHVVFHTASVLGVGSYLVLLGLVAYFVRAVGSQWTFAIELQFLVIAFGILLFVFYSEGIRRRLQTLLVKHFFRNKYDYRREWLRLTASLTRSGDVNLLATSGLEALAQIVGARHGELWLAREPGRYEWMAAIGGAVPSRRTFEADHPIVRFLAARFWVIDSEEYGLAPNRYEMAFGDPAAAVLPDQAIIVPLDCHGQLQGFVTLEKRDAESQLNFEDHDILKTAGKQLAIALAQAQALERLAETRQFEAMSKMSTFLMHDLKNILAQQQLLVSNAARFRHRPEFFDEAIATVRGGVERMRKVVEQIQGGAEGTGTSRADLTKVLMEVRSRCADRMPVPEIECPPVSLWVRMPRDKLVSVFTHLTRNAQDATPPDGHVRVKADRVGGEVICTVTDDGSGMDAAFIRDRLFRPFDSTKGEQGMGIGAYQARDLVRAAGGDLEVESVPTRGTTFRLRLPLAELSLNTSGNHAA